MAAFVEAILAEARLYQARVPLALRTVYLGGGTPTLLSEGHLERLLGGLRDILKWEALDEFALEVNPRTITPGKAAMLVRQGVSRASLGVQAWDAPTLATLGRDHSPAEAAATFQMLRDAGIGSMNLDLMFSIPGQPLAAWAATLQRTLELRPDHVSAYNLNYEEDTAFFEKLTRGQYREDPERDAEFFYLALDTLEAAGFEHYEISNYATPGHQSSHNEGYWMGRDYLGLGPSAFSTYAGERWQNIPDTQRYIAAIQSGILPQQDAEQITPDKRHIERIALELRTARGVPMAMLGAVPERTLTMLCEEHLIHRSATHVRLTREGKMLADSVAAALLE